MAVETNVGYSRTYKQILYIQNAQWFHTRFYSCVYKGEIGQMPHRYMRRMLVSDESVSQIFVFVPDPDNLFQEESIPFVKLTYTRPLYLGCGVTDPTIKVDFMANGMIMTHRQDVEWDPRTGFTVLEPTYHLTSDLKCNATSEKGETESRPFHVIVTEEGSSRLFIVAVVDI
ncbi:hypothetical protein BsWGS_18351 [Bradybaena similaris]